jgi:hypothetical protein
MHVDRHHSIGNVEGHENLLTQPIWPGIDPRTSECECLVMSAPCDVQLSHSHKCLCRNIRQLFPSPDHDITSGYKFTTKLDRGPSNRKALQQVEQRAENNTWGLKDEPPGRQKVAQLAHSWLVLFIRLGA